MVTGNIEERIKKMKEAILTEAKQRAHAIVENANQEADQQRAKIYNFEKQKIQHEFALLAKSEKIKEKIQKSALNNRHRIRRMQVRYEYVEKLKAEVGNCLRKTTKNEGQYEELIKRLIIQGMLRLMERNVTVQLKKEHIKVAEAQFSTCEKEFSQIMLQETDRDMESKLTISEYSLEEKNKEIIGGVFLRSSEGVIVCDNSLDSRVRLIFEQLLPNIRMLLFPKKSQEHSLI